MMITELKKMYQLVSLGPRRGLIILILLSVISAIIETFGIALIFPFIAILSVPDYINHSQALLAAYHLLGFSSQHSFFLFSGFCLLFILILGNLLLAYTSWYLYRYAYTQDHYFSCLLLKKYLNMPYSFFLDHNSATLLKNIVSEVRTVTQEVLISFLRILTRATTVILLCIFLLIYNPILTIILVCFLCVLYGAFSLFFKNLMNQKASENAKASTLKYKYAIEALNSIQDVKLMNLVDFVLKQYSRPSKSFSETKATSNIVSDLPRFLLEMFLFGGILLFIVIILLQNNTKMLAEAVPILAMFGYAGLRLMPSLNLVYQSYSMARFAAPSLDILYQDLMADNEPNKIAEVQKEVSLRNDVVFKDICFSYAGAEKDVFQNLNFMIHAHQCVGFVGQTGSGKTSIINLILGLLTPTSGQILVDGVPLDETTLNSWQQKIGYVPQSIYLIDDTIASNIAFGVASADIDQARLIKAAEMAELHTFITEELPQAYKTIVGERGVRLSGGQRQRIGIARALYRQPQLLVLDEATSALDNGTEKKILRNIHQQDAQLTTLMVAHRLTTVQACDTIFVLAANKGVVAEGNYNQLLESCEIFQYLVRSGNVESDSVDQE